MRVVYGLIDPRTPSRLSSVRYVGKTERPESRVARHVVQARAGSHHRANWIRALLAEGLRPALLVLEVVPDGASLELAEIRWIERLRTTNDLVNGTAGGTGGSTRPGPPWNKGLRTGPQSAAHRAAIGAGGRGKHGHRPSAETRAKLSAARRGRPHSPEHVAAQAAATRRTYAARRAAGMEPLC